MSQRKCFHFRQMSILHIARFAIGIVLTITCVNLRAGDGKSQSRDGGEDHIALVAPETFDGNRLVCLNSVDMAKSGPGWKLRLDRKVYDSLDLTAQAIMSVAEIPDGSETRLSLKFGDKQVWSHQVPIGQTGSNLAFVIDLRDLKPGKYTLSARLLKNNDELGGATAEFEMVPLVPGAVRPAREGSIPIGNLLHKSPH